MEKTMKNENRTMYLSVKGTLTDGREVNDDHFRNLQFYNSTTVVDGKTDLFSDNCKVEKSTADVASFYWHLYELSKSLGTITSTRKNVHAWLEANNLKVFGFVSTTVCPPTVDFKPVDITAFDIDKLENVQVFTSCADFVRISGYTVNRGGSKAQLNTAIEVNGNAYASIVEQKLEALRNKEKGKTRQA